MRFRQIDLDGAFAHSAVVETVIGVEGLTLFAPRPNPSAGGGGRALCYGVSEQATVSVCDAIGRRAVLLFGKAQAGAVHSATLGSDLAAGVYVIVFESQGERRVQRWGRTR